MALHLTELSAALVNDTYGVLATVSSISDPTHEDLADIFAASIQCSCSQWQDTFTDTYTPFQSSSEARPARPYRLDPATSGPSRYSSTRQHDLLRSRLGWRIQSHAFRQDSRHHRGALRIW